MKINNKIKEIEKFVNFPNPDNKIFRKMLNNLVKEAKEQFQKEIKEVQEDLKCLVAEYNENIDYCYDCLNEMDEIFKKRFGEM